MPSRENALVLRAVDFGGKNTEEAPRLESELPPQQVQRSAQVGGHPGEGRWAVTPSEGKDADSTDSRKTFIIPMF